MEIRDIAPSEVPPTPEERRALAEARLHNVPLMDAISRFQTANYTRRPYGKREDARKAATFTTGLHRKDRIAPAQYTRRPALASGDAQAVLANMPPMSSKTAIQTVAANGEPAARKQPAPSASNQVQSEWLRVSEAIQYSRLSKPKLYDLINRGLIKRPAPTAAERWPT